MINKENTCVHIDVKRFVIKSNGESKGLVMIVWWSHGCNS
jgi:hypothetical protein